MDETLGQLLVAEGFSSIEEINQAKIEEITNELFLIEGKRPMYRIIVISSTFEIDSAGLHSL